MFNRRSPHIREDFTDFNVPNFASRLQKSFSSIMAVLKTCFNSITFNLMLALLIRVGFMLYGIWQDAVMRVKYTDVDYMVFSDAAIHVSKVNAENG